VIAQAQAAPLPAAARAEFDRVTATARAKLAQATQMRESVVQ
jgi:hypothetical protein